MRMCLDLSTGVWGYELELRPHMSKHETLSLFLKAWLEDFILLLVLTFLLASTITTDSLRMSCS